MAAEPVLNRPLKELKRFFDCFPLLFSDIMADKDGIKPIEDDADDETSLNYKAPEKKSLQEIQEMDKNDESLNKYKQALLGNMPATVGESEPKVSGATPILSSRAAVHFTFVIATKPAPFFCPIENWMTNPIGEVIGAILVVTQLSQDQI